MDKEDSGQPNAASLKDDKLEEKTDSIPESNSMDLNKLGEKEESIKADSPSDKPAIKEPTKSGSALPNAKDVDVYTATNSTPLNAEDVDGKEDKEVAGKMESANSDSASSNVGEMVDLEISIIEDSVPPNSKELENDAKDGAKEDGLGELNDTKDERADQELKQKVHTVQEMGEDKDMEAKARETTGLLEEDIDKEDLREHNREEKEPEPVFDGTEVPGMEENRSMDLAPDSQGNNWPEKAVAIKNFVREKSVGAVSTMLRRLSGKRDDIGDVNDENIKEVADPSEEGEAQEGSQKACEKPSWNPLSYFRFSRDADDSENKIEAIDESAQSIPMKGRAILYTRLGCQQCKEARLFLYRKRLRYVEINIDVYPSRKHELERISGSSSVPKLFFNEVLIGGISELKGLEESGKLKDKLDYLISEAPSHEAPLPPLSGEDDVSSSGSVDELALIVRKMKESVIVKDRFYKMRWFTNCFVVSEAVDFISEDQYLEREEAVEFGRKLASKLFFQHILDENLFEDGNHFYRFLDDDPIVSTQCYNIPRGIIEVKPKPITEIASRLRFLSYAILDAYTSEDGRHVDYRSIHGSEEFARYLRIVEELQRVELVDMSREEKLAFFINLYNMMAIHAVLVWGHPAGPLERRKLFGDFKYVVGGCTYSLSAIQNGILRGNQRPPYNLMKPFGAKDKRAKVALPYPETLIHFSLVCGTRSGPALRCYSPGNVDKELVEAARDFLRNGGLVFDLNAKVAYVSKILKWFSVDFGKNEVEVLKHASNYLETSDSEALLESLSNIQLKVIYQPYDWGLNC